MKTSSKSLNRYARSDLAIVNPVDFAMLHSLVDAADPQRRVARLAGAQSSGNYLAASHATADFMPAAATGAIAPSLQGGQRPQPDTGQLRDWRRSSDSSRA